MKHKNPDWSIITVTLNASRHIDKNIKNIDGIKDVSYEHIIFDGGSNDATVEIISRSKNPSRKLICGSDSGIYDAMNQAISLSIGKYIAIINSDDFYSDPYLLSNVQKIFDNEEAEIITTNISYQMDYNAPIVRKTKLKISNNPNYRRLFYFGIQFPHPGLFVSKEAYNKYGLYDGDMKISADYEFQLRVLTRKDIRHSHCDINGTVQINGGKSQTDLAAFILGKKEIAISVRRYLTKNIILVYFTILCNLIRKAGQQIFKNKFK